ncbi:OmpA family protein [Flavobacterium jejuense]|uniref:OmpA family protein n=1 Tax=Flavobacterium jejuense TaxID=1544455 RepID=A0ABX0IU09_9FLAO|nr:OmpA family protein [Flavobacterium jejuense]NHN26701.1 OmpA family protein [Flavobacterium jejuense]
MSKKALYLLGILATILLGTWLYVTFCCNCCSVECPSLKKENHSKENPTKAIHFAKTSGFHFTSPDLSYNCNNNFNFLASNFNILIPVSDSIDLGISKLRTVLEKNNTTVKIVGVYANNEENSSIFTNLGLARANSVKNYFLSKGIAEKNIEISEQLQDELTIKDDTLIGSIHFEILDFNVNISKIKNWQTIKKNINATPLTLYFNTGQSSITLTQLQKQQIADIIDYINHVEGSKINITGHSDNDPGVRNTNQYYSEERAKFAKKYFVSNGIPENKIEASGKGELQPIADNTTEEGRAKNRRTEITIK